MASPAWLPQEVQSSTSQAPVSGLPAGETGGTAAPSLAAPAQIAGTSSSEVSSGTSTDSMHESTQAKVVNAPGFVVPASSFSYSVLPNASTISGSSQQSSPTAVIKSNPPVSTVVLPLFSGPSSSTTPTFSYISHTSAGLPDGQQFQSKSNTSAADVNILSSALSIPHSAPLPLQSSSSSIMSASSTANLVSETPWMRAGQAFPVPARISGTLGMPAPPGILQSVSSSSNPIVPYAVVDSSSSAVVRPVMPTAPILSNSAVQQQTYHTYPALPAMALPPQSLWLRPPQMGGLPRLPFLSYPSVVPGPFPFPAHGLPLPSVPLPDSHPPGVTPVGSSGAILTSAVDSAHPLLCSSGMHPELSPPGIGNNKHVNGAGIKDGFAVNEQSDSWTTHKTDTGVVYYYNALTGASTYEKPSGFKEESDKVTIEPIPVSWEKLAGTDWALVTTNDGNKYYYNTKTLLSSWQIPTEVMELKKKQGGEILNEHMMLVPDTNVLPEKGSAPISLSASAIVTGGRDATPFRSSAAPGSSSALDLVKKKLQDSGAPDTSSAVPATSGLAVSELNGVRAVEATVRCLQSENSKDKLNDAIRDGNISDSSSESEDADGGPTKEQCIIQFKEMLKDRGVAPFSKWEKELPKIVFDSRFKAIPSHSARRSLFDHYVKTRAEEERKEKRAAQKAAVEIFKKLLEEASEDIDHNTDYQTFRKKWGNDPRFEVLDRKDRELLLNERVLPLKRAAEEKAQAIRAAVASNFKSMLRDKGDITATTRWSRVKDSLRNDSRYKSVKHDDREVLFNEYISELKTAEVEAVRETNVKREEQEKLKERERELRKRKKREEQEMEWVRVKVRRKEAVASYQALLVEAIRDPQASWTESKPKLEKDPQGRATNPDLDLSDIEKLFREHVKLLHERCVQDFRDLLAEVLSGGQKSEDGKTVLNSWSTAKRLLKPDPRYHKMPRKEREPLWRRYGEEMQRRQKLADDTQAKTRNSFDSGRLTLPSKDRKSVV